MKRGEIYWAHLHPRSGSEQRGKRPVLVISHDGFNQIPSWRSVIVIPLSSSERQAARGPTSVMIPKGTSGLSKACVLLCHQITTLDRAKLTQKIGILSLERIREVEIGIQKALGMYQFD